jgi:phospholipase/lecithinase/hemolysin
MFPRTSPPSLAVFLALWFTLAPASRPLAAEPREVVAFGDSLTDMGNRVAETRRPDLKFRQNWVAQLAGRGMLNAPEFKPSGMSYFYGGTNYAVGGATTAYTAKISNDRNKGQNLTQQVTRRYLNPQFNPAGAKPEALHVVVIGANDLMRACICPEHILTRWANLDAVGVAVAKSTEGQIEALATAGVKEVLWGNLFDVAKTPSLVNKVALLGGEQSPVVLAAISKAIDAHNQEMASAMTRLQTKFPNLQIIKLDLHAKFAEVAAAPAKFGFTDVTTGANDDRHLFSADGLHPTAKGHEMLAKYAFDTVSSQLAAAQ